VTQRLILFCADVEVDLEQVHRAVAALGAKLAVGPLEVDEIEGPAAVSAKGWVTLVVRAGGSGGELSGLETHLDEMVKGCAQALREDVLGLYLDAPNSYARAALRSPAGFPRAVEGEIFHVIRQAATWLEADAAQLMRHFAPARPKNELSAPAADLADIQGVSEEKEVEAEPDEDDRFVEAKLKAGREWMQRYLAQRSKGPNQG
jgi:hypothetical protein